MFRAIRVLATVELLGFLGAGCSDSNPGTQPFSGSGGSAGGDSNLDASSGTSGGDGGIVGKQVCPLNGFPADGGCRCEFGLNAVCPGKNADGGVVQACVDTTSDPDNCGACGTVCQPTAGCVSSKCGPSPMALVAAEPGCISLRLGYENGKIYWSDEGHGTIKSIATTGGSATTVSPGEMAPTALIVHNGSLYWIASGDNTIRTLGASATAATTLLAMGPPVDGGLGEKNGVGTIAGIALSPDANTLYFSAGTSVYQMPVAGGTVKEVGFSEGPRHGTPQALAVDANFIYYPTGGNGNIEILSRATMCDPAAADPPAGQGDPTCPIRIGRSQMPINDTIVVKGDNLYWTDNARIKVGFVSSALDGGLGGGDYPDAVNLGKLSGFALGTLNAYFGEDALDNDQVTHLPGYIEKAGNPPYAVGMNPGATIIARQQTLPRSVVVDGTSVYWTTSSCDIQQLADSPQ